MRLPFLAALAALALALPGCVTPGDVASPSALDVEASRAAAYATLRELAVGLPCEGVAVTGGATSANLLDVTNLLYDETTHGEVDIAGDWMLVARYQGGGFEVVNVADPTDPVWASQFQTEEANAQDVKWMPDGRTAVVGVNTRVYLVDVGPVLDSAVPLRDMMDREVFPVELSAWEYTKFGVVPNMHMLTTARIGETDYVFVAPNNDDGVWVLKLVGEGDARILETVTNFYPLVLGGGPLGPHDMSLVWDGFTEKPILYVANGFEGWAAYDMSDPATPALLAVMPNLLLAQGYTHTVLGQKVGERRIVVAISEVGANVMQVFDATDFAAPVLLAQWWADKTAPHAPQHNIQIVDGKLYLAHYTRGVYVFDLATLPAVPLLGTLTWGPIAQWLPPSPEPSDTLGFSNVWDVVVHNGLVYVNEQQKGTHVIAFGCLEPGNASQTSRN